MDKLSQSGAKRGSLSVEKGSLLGDLQANQRRVRSDPRIIQIHKDARAKGRREMKPVFHIGLVFSALLHLIIVGMGIVGTPLGVASWIGSCSLLYFVLL